MTFTPINHDLQPVASESNSSLLHYLGRRLLILAIHDVTFILTLLVRWIFIHRHREHFTGSDTW